MTRASTFVDVPTPDRGSWIVVRSQGRLAGATFEVLSIKPGEHCNWLELRLPTGEAWCVPADGLDWIYAEASA